MTTDSSVPKAGAAARAVILPLALAQFIASYAATNMNVAISSIAKDLGTTVAGVQMAITLLTLTMAALTIPGSKLTDIWGRKRCFVIGLAVYGLGGLLGMGTQTIEWLILQGSFFAVSAYLQEVNHYNAIQTGLMLTPATIGSWCRPCTGPDLCWHYFPLHANASGRTIAGMRIPALDSHDGIRRSAVLGREGPGRCGAVIELVVQVDRGADERHVARS